MEVVEPRHRRGLLAGALLVLLILAAGTLGYHFIGRPTASWIDSFYMTFITISTIGYGETIDLSTHPMGRLFTVAIAILGIGTLSYVFSIMVAVLVNTDLNARLRVKRMQYNIENLSGHYIICGIGRVGSNVAEELRQTRRRFVVIELDRDVLDNWLDRHPDELYRHDDAATDQALLQAGLMRSAGVFAVTGDDSHNLMIAMSVKLLAPKVRVVVRLHDIRNEQKARRAGADEIVSPDFIGGMHIASAMVRPNVVNFMDQMLHTEEVMRLEEVNVPAGLNGRALGEFDPRGPHHLLLAVRRDGRWQFNPDDRFVVATGDTLMLMTDPTGRGAIESRMAAMERPGGLASSQTEQAHQ